MEYGIIDKSTMGQDLMQYSAGRDNNRQMVRETENLINGWRERVEERDCLRVKSSGGEKRERK